MFDIEYKGGNTVIISTKSLKLVTDPKLSLIGLKDVVSKDMIELATEPRFIVNSPDARLVIEGPGEYEIGDFSIRGIPATRHIDTEAEASGTTIYRIAVGEVNLALIGNIAAKLNEAQLEAIGVVDIVIIPVGGNGYTLDSADAAKLIRQIDPKVVIPVHYDDKALTYEVPQDDMSAFKAELSASIEAVDKYKLKSAASLPASLTLIELKRT